MAHTRAARGAKKRASGRTHREVRDEPAEGSKAQEIERESNPFKRVFKLLGPGLVTGAAQMDPSAIATYAVAGAALGLGPLWTALYTLPLVIVAESTVGRIGLVAREGLATALRKHVPRPLLVGGIVLLVIATVINIGADLGAIGEGVHMLTGLPVQPLTIPAAALTAATVVFGSYRVISNVFKTITLAFLAYVVTAFFVHASPGDIVGATLVPSIPLDRHGLQVLVAVLGTTISPYLLFWQSDEEVEEKKEETEKRGAEAARTSKADVRQSTIDVSAGMFSANLVMFCIILTTALTLHANGKYDVRSGADAAEALRPVLGDLASTLFAVGLIAAGLLAVPVLAGSAAYAVGETLGWRTGLDEKWWQAPPFYAVFIAATVVGVLLNFSGVSPIDALFLTSVIMGLISPLLLALTVMVARDRRVMGSKERIGPWLTAAGVIAVVVMAAAVIGLFWSLLRGG
ncbi:MAG TPA: divalent metal cation transporter [Candidatus Limnocylindria bacterium]